MGDSNTHKKDDPRIMLAVVRFQYNDELLYNSVAWIGSAQDYDAPAWLYSSPPWPMTERTRQSRMVTVISNSVNTIIDREVSKIENVASFCPYPMDSKLPNTSVYNVLAMHAMYAPLIEMHAASDAVYTTLDNVDAFSDDRIVAAKDEMIAIALDRKGAVDKVSKKQGDEEEKKKKLHKPQTTAARPRRLCLYLTCAVLICTIA